MRTRRLGGLCGLTLAVAAGHWAAWRLALAEAPRAAPPRPGVRRVAWVVPARPRAAAPVVDPGLAARRPLQAPARASHRPAAAQRASPGAARRPRLDDMRAGAAVGAPPASPPPLAPIAPVASMAPVPPMPPVPTMPTMPTVPQALPETPARPVPPRGERALARPRDDARGAWPVYPTHAPPTATLHYAMTVCLPPAGGRRAAAEAGRATLAWSRDAHGFALLVATTVDGRAGRSWRSTGGFDGAGLAPERLAEHARGRERRAVDFDRGAARVRFSSAAGDRATAPGVQDRWSWIVQLAAIAQARADAGRAVAPGTRWTLQVAGLRGDLDRWEFRVLDDGDDRATVPAATRAPPLLHVLREPARPYDLRVEAWLSPALHHLPERLRLSTPPSAWAMSLALDEPAPGPAAARPGPPNAR